MRVLHKIDGLSASEISTLIEEHIVGNKAYRNREIVKARMIDGYTYEKIAEKFDMSTPMIKKIVYRAMDRISPFIN